MDHRSARKPVLVNRRAGVTRTEEKQGKMLRGVALLATFDEAKAVESLP
jgi:hypothetical protein